MSHKSYLGLSTYKEPSPPSPPPLHKSGMLLPKVKIQYCTVHNDSRTLMEEEVNSLIEEGWIPLGGMAVSDDYGFCQAMTRTRR